MVTYPDTVSWSYGVQWLLPLTNVIISYEVDRYLQDGTSAQTLPLQTSATLGGLYPHATYTIHIRVVWVASIPMPPTPSTSGWCGWPLSPCHLHHPHQGGVGGLYPHATYTIHTRVVDTVGLTSNPANITWTTLSLK